MPNLINPVQRTSPLRRATETRTTDVNEPAQRYINRELSWLQFNRRVLEEARNEDHPLLERVGFLSISGKNLDEFLMVRVAGLYGQVREGVTTKSPDGLEPAQQIEEIHKEIAELSALQEVILEKLKADLAFENIRWVMPSSLERDDRKWLETFFHEELFPILTPLAVDPAHPFPFIPNGNLCLAFELRNKNGNPLKALVRIPPALKRLIVVDPNSIEEKGLRVVVLEDVITCFFDQLFPNSKVVSTGLFRVIRDSEIEIDEEAEDLVRSFELVLRQRRRGRVIHLETSPMSETLKSFVCASFHVTKQQILSEQRFIGFGDLDQIKSLRSDLQFESYIPRSPERIKEHGGDIFSAIRQKDFIVHHPYESFDTVLRYLLNAADDPQVVSIKQTLYRTSNDSPIIKALVRAAESGKSVTAVVELKARFDEEANIRWARDLERAGVQVVFGFIELKTHAKLSLVTRREDGKLVNYAHVGTGNYHPITARIYTDLSFFSADRDIARDIGLVFNFITGYAEADQYRSLYASPKTLRSRLLELIENEITIAKRGGKGAIWLKANSLVDEGIIKALYRASAAGVKVELIIRGICCLRPGVPGLSEHISVKSIIGRFLEHSRIYCFGNGNKLPNPKAFVYISSADLMPRNLDRRVEIMLPITNPTVHEQVLVQVMANNLADAKRSWIMEPSGAFKRHPDHRNAKAQDVHHYFMTNPSLSGRGKSAKKR